ncbi:hypothetical protein EVAR_102210_1 [Eumeta japonica]|uniref:Uncharacterized protein n=1 Tax=Eumeta variegata TaxID=151549 RepID=A0A4C1WGL2_EUMVA|nr:hypothetical protein EVAR_102210_1 [Eumeta japonica]
MTGNFGGLAEDKRFIGVNVTSLCSEQAQKAPRGARGADAGPRFNTRYTSISATLPRVADPHDKAKEYFARLQLAWRRRVNDKRANFASQYD